MEKILTAEFWTKCAQRKWLLLTWGYALPLVVVIVLSVKFEASLSKLNEVAFTYPMFGYLLWAVALLPFNLLIESYKWSRMVEDFKPMNIFDSFKVILSGKSLNMISPFGLGDGLTRFLPFAKDQKINGAVLILLDRLTKTIPTYLLGMIATSYLVWHEMNIDYRIFGIAFIVLTGMGLMIYLLGAKPAIFNRLQRIKFSLQAIEGRDLILYAVLSILRYSVFTLQFYWIFRGLGVSASTEVVILGIFWIFFLKSILPSLSIFGDLAVRELSALTFFSFFGIAVEPIILGTFLIWFINILAPSVIGVFFIGDSKKYIA